MINIDDILSEVDSLCSADMSEIVFKEYMEAENFPSHHQVLTGIRNGAIIPYIDAKPDPGFMKVSQGNCQTNTCDVNTTSSAKKWSPIDYDCRLVICKEDLSCDFRKFWDMNCKDFDNMEDGFMAFLIDQVNKSFNISQWRIAYFDNQEAENPDYQGVEGLFAQMLDAAVPGQNLINIPENEEATIALQMQLAEDRAYNVLKAMYDWFAINNPGLLARSGVHFDVTPELAHNYLSYLQKNRELLCCFSSTDGITASRYSLDGLNYLGIPIRIRYEWRDIIQWARGEAANYDNPHRAVLTTTNNKPIGTCDDRSFRNFDTFYDKKDKQIYIDIATSMDAKLLVDEDFAIAI